MRGQTWSVPLLALAVLLIGCASGNSTPAVEGALDGTAATSDSRLAAEVPTVPVVVTRALTPPAPTTAVASDVAGTQQILEASTATPRATQTPTKRAPATPRATLSPTTPPTPSPEPTASLTATSLPADTGVPAGDSDATPATGGAQGTA